MRLLSFTETRAFWAHSFAVGHITYAQYLRLLAKLRGAK